MYIIIYYKKFVKLLLKIKNPFLFLFLIIVVFNFSTLPIFAIKKEDLQINPQIILSYPQENPVNKEIKIFLSVSNFKNSSYDVKVSIEKEKTLSEIYNEKNLKWQSSHYYIKNFFSGNSFEGFLKLKIKKDYLNFQGEADIVVRIRENGKNNYLERREKINIIPSETSEKNNSFFLTNFSNINQKTFEKEFFSRLFIFSFCLALFSGILILTLKIKLKGVNKNN